MLLKLVEFTIIIDSFTPDNTYREIWHLRSREGHAATRNTSLTKSNQSEIRQVNLLINYFSLK